MHGFCGSEQYLLSKDDAFYTLYFYLLCFDYIILSFEVVLGFLKGSGSLGHWDQVCKPVVLGLHLICKWIKTNKNTPLLHHDDLIDLKYGYTELGSYYNFYFRITWVTWVISPTSSMFYCLWDRINSYFRYFETQEGKQSKPYYVFFGKWYHGWKNTSVCL